MAKDVRVVHARDFLKATVQGQLDLAQSKETLLEIARAGVFSGEAELMIDVRESPANLSLAELWELAVEFSKVFGDSGRKTAILTSPDRYGNAEFFAITAKNMGLRVHAFASFEDAFDWLAL